MTKLIELCAHPDGCPRPRAKHRRYCKPHANRKARTGSFGPVEIRAKGKSGEGSLTRASYKEFYLPDHPLATKHGKVREHRMVLYAHLNGQDAPCNWCGKDLEWQRDLFVDHVDFDKLNNDISNLVPSCSSCNVKRFNKLVRYILENHIVNKEILRSL